MSHFSLLHNMHTGSETLAYSYPVGTSWVLGALSPLVKRLEREADHSPKYSAEVRNAWSYTSTARLHGVELN
jgi:hypothetical protein